MEHIRIPQVILSDVGAAAVAGTAIRVTGEAVDVQFFGPAAFHEVQQSNDGVVWVIAVDIAAANITALGPVYRRLRDRPEWVRGRTIQDAAGPRLYEFSFGIHKETG